MKDKYQINFSEKAIDNYLLRTLNQVYKLLPSREEGLDWEGSLLTIVEEFSGFCRLYAEDPKADLCLRIMCKLKGLRALDFYEFRRAVFETMSCMGDLRNYVKHK